MSGTISRLAASDWAVNIEELRDDDNSTTGAPDRDGVSAEDEPEMSYFASKFNQSTDEVRALIRRCGNDRATLEGQAGAIKNATEARARDADNA